MAYRILISSLVVCLLVVGGLLMLERTGFIEIDEKVIQPEVVSSQVGHNDMKVSVQGNRDYYRGEVVPRYEFWLPRSAGAPCTTGTGPKRAREAFARTIPRPRVNRPRRSPSSLPHPPSWLMSLHFSHHPDASLLAEPARSGALTLKRLCERGCRRGAAGL